MTAQRHGLIDWDWGKNDFRFTPMAEASVFCFNPVCFFLNIPEVQAEGSCYIVRIDTYEFELQLNKEYSAQYFAEALSMGIDMKRWGDQIYRACPIPLGSYIGSTSAMQVRQLAYWPPGKTLCLFLGPLLQALG